MEYHRIFCTYFSMSPHQAAIIVKKKKKSQKSAPTSSRSPERPPHMMPIRVSG